MKTDVRAHTVLGKKFDPIDYVVDNGRVAEASTDPSGNGSGTSTTMRGRIEAHVARIRIRVDGMLLRYSSDGYSTLRKMRDKASKAEMAALASMRPYQRKRYERLLKLGTAFDALVACCLLAMMFVSGMALILSLNSLFRDGSGGGDFGGDAQNEGGDRPLDGHIYSLDGPVDSDGYPLSPWGSSAEENYAACLADAEGRLGMNGDPTVECDPNAYFFAAMTTITPVTEDVDDDGAAMMSPLRSRIHDALTTKLKFPPSLSAYLTTLRTTTISYLASLFVFVVLVASHYVAHRIGMATMRNDPMRHFVLTAVDKSVKADGTVEARRGETEAQRKRRERMMQSERMKAQMAQLAMEAKLRVEERRIRLEGAAAVEREKEEEGRRVEEVGRKVEEESEEMVKNHGRQYMMIKAGVPEGAILNSLIAEGFEDEAERKEIIDKLQAIKKARAEAARLAEEEEAKRVEENRRKETEEEEEKERIAKERLRVMKSQRSTGSAPGIVGVAATTGGGAGSLTRSLSLPVTNDGGAELRKKLSGRKAHASSLSMSTLPAPKSSVASPDPEVEVSSVITSSSKSTTASSITDPSVARANMLGQIGRATRKSESTSNGIVHSTPLPRHPNNTSEAPSAGMQTNESRKGASKKVLLNTDTPTKSNTVSRPDEVPPLPKTNCGTETEEEEEEEGEKIGKFSTIESATEHLPPLLVKDISKSVEGPNSGFELNDDSSENSPPPILVRVSSSPDCDALLPIDQCYDFSSPSMWDQRPSARDIQATITAVENAPDDIDAGEGRKAIDLAPGWFHSSAFERAMRNSNASWDRRPSARDIQATIAAVENTPDEVDAGGGHKAIDLSRRRPTSRDVLAKIRAVEMMEAKVEEERAGGTAAADAKTPLRRGQRAMADDSMGIPVQARPLAPIYATTLKRKNTKGGASDDEISELSDPTYQSLELNAFKGRAVPQALLVPQSNDFVALSPMVSSVSLATPNLNNRKLLPMNDDVKKLREVILPSMSSDSVCAENEASASINLVEEMENEPVVDETEEQKLRREKAEARVRKMEAIAARRNAGIDEDESSISVISKRHRLRRKKKVLLPSISQEEGSVKSDDKSNVTPVREETKEETQRKKRAEARAKKLEDMSSMRNSGIVDDDTAVSGISRRHRIRRKKSALAANAPTPEERERNDWKKSVYATVLNAEQVKWRTSIYTCVLNAETTRAKNLEVKRELDELNLASQRRLDNKKRLDKMAKKFAARAEKFYKIRLEGGADDDSSVVSATSRVKRRRNRKSVMRQSLGAPLVEESAGDAVQIEGGTTNQIVPTEEEKEEVIKRKQWCAQIYVTALQADQMQWKKSVYHIILNAEEKRAKRMELQALIARQRITAEAIKEKARQVELRARKMEVIAKLRQEAEGPGGGVENIAPAGCEDAMAGLVYTEGGSSMKKMRDRRKKAAMKNASK
ncbi:hypothetical protein ACHAXA_002963 [Cyclostephanos tholiformis]|uniref:Uncharacterized protein n=1 Tax=Cyclostephanos tholiformis TaxID=382380 RepID=A0ABD3SCA1_9STRA